jgi:hypothetical protein
VTDETDLRYKEDDLGGRTYTCKYCKAKLWKEERTRTQMCCSKGRVDLSQQFPDPPPEVVRELFTAQPASDAAKEVRENARAYNSAFQMAYSRIDMANPPSGLTMIAIKGAIHHMIGPLLPAAEKPEEFAQLYIIDNHEQQVTRRIQAMAGSDEDEFKRRIMSELQAMLLDENKYVREIR